MGNMNFLLIVPIVYLIIETIIGYKRGFIKSILLLLSWILSIACSALLVKEFVEETDKMQEFAGYFTNITGDLYDEIAVCISIFLLLLVFLKICFRIVIHLTGVLEHLPVVGTANNILGGLFGFIKGLLIVGIVFMAYQIYNGSYVAVLWDKMPKVMYYIDYAESYLRQLWSIYGR